MATVQLDGAKSALCVSGSAQVIKHDHCYSLDPSLFETEKLATPVQTTGDNMEYAACILDDSTIVAFKERLRVSSELRHQIQESTHQQSSMEWFSAQAHRITSSVYGQILIQKKRSIPLLTQVLYHKSFYPLESFIGNVKSS